MTSNNKKKRKKLFQVDEDKWNFMLKRLEQHFEKAGVAGQQPLRRADRQLASWVSHQRHEIHQAERIDGKIVNPILFHRQQRLQEIGFIFEPRQKKNKLDKEEERRESTLSAAGLKKHDGVRKFTVTPGTNLNGQNLKARAGRQRREYQAVNVGDKAPNPDPYSPRLKRLKEIGKKKRKLENEEDEVDFPSPPVATATATIAADARHPPVAEEHDINSIDSDTLTECSDEENNSDACTATVVATVCDDPVPHLQDQLDVLKAENHSLKEKLCKQQEIIEQCQKELASSKAEQNQTIKLLRDNNKKTSNELAHIQTEHQKEISRMRTLVEENVMRIEMLERLLEDQQQQVAKLGTTFPNDPLFCWPVAPAAVADARSLNRRAPASITPAQGDPGTWTPKCTHSTTNVNKKQRQATDPAAVADASLRTSTAPEEPETVTPEATRTTTNLKQHQRQATNVGRGRGRGRQRDSLSREARVLNKSNNKFTPAYYSPSYLSATSSTTAAPQKNLGMTDGAPAVASRCIATTAAASQTSNSTCTPPKKRSRISAKSGSNAMILNLTPATTRVRFKDFPPPCSSSSSHRHRHHHHHSSFN